MNTVDLVVRVNAQIPTRFRMCDALRLRCASRMRINVDVADELKLFIACDVMVTARSRLCCISSHIGYNRRKEEVTQNRTEFGKIQYQNTELSPWNRKAHSTEFERKIPSFPIVAEGRGEADHVTQKYERLRST